jgi:hypothetical protein
LVETTNKPSAFRAEQGFPQSKADTPREINGRFAFFYQYFTPSGVKKDNRTDLRLTTVNL